MSTLIYKSGYFHKEESFQATYPPKIALVLHYSVFKGRMFKKVDLVFHQSWLKNENPSVFFACDKVFITKIFIH